jgi:signal transduction histidine kinase
LVKELEGQIRLGVMNATPAVLTQVQAMTSAFRKGNVRADAVSVIARERFDLYLLIAEAGSDAAGQLKRQVMLAGLTPCLVLAIDESDALEDIALAAGAVDFLSWMALDVARLERSVFFALQRRHLIDALTMREICLAEAHERERQQLANALHDGPLQDLIGARFLLGALASSGTPEGQTNGDAVAEIQNSLQTVIQAIRALCSELKPPALGPFGLEKAIRAHMQGVLAHYPDLEVTLELAVEQQQLPEWARSALFRVLQQSVANVTQHAQATQLWVRLRLEGEQIHLTVADDGQGFEVPQSWLDFARTERCGLLMMQERVDALEGRMMVQSTPGSGTRVMVEVPLDQPPAPLPATLAPMAPDRNG